MKIPKILIKFSVLLLIIFGCTKEEIIEVDQNPQLEIQVLDETNSVVQNATVKLFNSENDWESQTNALKENTTDTEGKALFVDLAESQYYFYAEKGDLNNYYEVATFSEPLKKNEKRTINCIIR